MSARPLPVKFPDTKVQPDVGETLVQDSQLKPVPVFLPTQTVPLAEELYPKMSSSAPPVKLPDIKVQPAAGVTEVQGPGPQSKPEPVFLPTQTVPLLGW